MEEKVTIELCKNHRTYILRRFVMIKGIEVIMTMIISNPYDHLDQRYSFPGLVY
jgi:hypothetical protein